MKKVLLSSFRQLITFKRFTSMDKTLSEIFQASVDAVRPTELIGKRKFVQIYKSSGREFVEIGKAKKYDVTDKKIHMGEYKCGVISIYL